MSIQIFHGDYIQGARLALQKEVARLRTSGSEITYLEGASLTPKELETHLLSETLFNPLCLVIEGLLSRPRSKEKLVLIASLTQAKADKNILLFDNKLLTKPTLDLLKGAKVGQFKTPAIIFTFLESITPGSYARSGKLYEETLRTSEAGFIFIMLTRHLANLLIAKSGDTSKLIPFMRAKLAAQAKAWSESSLVEFHHKLFEIDLAVKTGKTKLSYREHLDLLLTSLLN